MPLLYSPAHSAPSNSLIGYIMSLSKTEEVKVAKCIIFRPDFFLIQFFLIYTMVLQQQLFTVHEQFLLTSSLLPTWGPLQPLGLPLPSER